jgi:hypothetical protein
VTQHDAALALALILQVLDVLTTRKGMRLGLTEGNPVMRAVMRATGDGWWLWKLIAASAVVWPLWAYAESAMALWIVNAAMALVILWNVKLIFNRKKG